MNWNNLLWLAGRAIAETADAAGGLEAGVEPVSGVAMLVQMVPMLLVVVALYFIMIRPQRKKDKKVKEMLSALKAGDRVTTIGGIHGTIESIKDETVTLLVGADKVRLVFARWAIRNVEEVSIENDSEMLN